MGASNFDRGKCVFVLAIMEILWTSFDFMNAYNIKFVSLGLVNARSYRFGPDLDMS